MYIRRKVFSLLNVEGEDRYFSTTEFSLTENGEVRLFAEKEEPKKEEKKDLGKKVAIGAGAAAAGTAAGVAGAHKVGSVLREAAKKEVKELAEKGELTGKAQARIAKKSKVGENLQKPGQKVKEVSEKVAEQGKKAGRKVAEVAKETSKKVSKEAAKVAKKVVKK